MGKVNHAMRFLAAIKRNLLYLIGDARFLTEAEWLAGINALRMIEYLGSLGVSDRKLRLFACACCRRFWPVLNERGRTIVEAAERYAEGDASLQELAALPRETRLVLGAQDWSNDSFAIHHAALQTLDEDAWEAALHSSNVVAILEDVSWDREEAAQCALLRCLFGNPFRTVPWDPTWLSWHDALLVSMARRMYESGDFADMPVLADALEEVGCTDAAVLNHCRQAGEHVRGCWVVDLLLGKS